MPESVVEEFAPNSRWHVWITDAAHKRTYDERLVDVAKAPYDEGVLLPLVCRPVDQ
jgi:hypothetical protein